MLLVASPWTVSACSSAGFGVTGRDLGRAVRRGSGGGVALAGEISLIQSRNTICRLSNFSALANEISCRHAYALAGHLQLRHLGNASLCAMRPDKLIA
jgi:hypothetical protein